MRRPGPVRWVRQRIDEGGRDRGATLIYALLFITVVSVVIGAVTSASGARLRTTVALRDQAATASAVDGAGQIAINEIRRSTYAGGDNSCFRSGSSSSRTLLLSNFYRLPSSGQQSSVLVWCDYVNAISHWGTYIYMEVYACPNSSTCSTSTGRLALKFKIELVDPSGAREIVVVAWSVQR